MQAACSLLQGDGGLWFARLWFRRPRCGERLHARREDRAARLFLKRYRFLVVPVHRVFSAAALSSAWAASLSPAKYSQPALNTGRVSFRVQASCCGYPPTRVVCEGDGVAVFLYRILKLRFVGHFHWPITGFRHLVSAQQYDLLVLELDRWVRHSNVLKTPVFPPQLLHARARHGGDSGAGYDQIEQPG